MLNSSNTVTFEASPGTDWETEVLSVEYDWEAIGGKVEEDEDFVLIENWSDYRVLISIHLYIPSNESAWFLKTFLPSKTKILTIDDEDIPVVLDMKNVNFKHLLSRNFSADVKLKFKHKDPGPLPVTPPP